MVVDRGGARREPIDIRDGHTHTHAPIRPLFGDGELVEIARVVVIDRTPEELPEIEQRCVRRGRLGKARRLGPSRLRDLGLEAAFEHRAVGDGNETGSD